MWLAQACGFAERLGGVGVLWIAALVPALGFQRIDAVHAAHQIHEAATDPLAHILLFMLHIQRYNGLSCLQKLSRSSLSR